MVDTVVVGKLDNLLNGIDMKDTADIDNVFPAETYKKLVIGELAGYSGLYFGETERHHEMRARRVKHMGVMVIRL